IDGMANENLAKDMYKNPENAKTMRRFEDIRIEGDKVIVTLKPLEKPDASDATSDTTTDDVPVESTDLESVGAGSESDDA
ncbi:MAG: hypothetical protein WBD20_20540, partial [Pirellulaceae bacterium]